MNSYLENLNELRILFDDLATSIELNFNLIIESATKKSLIETRIAMQMDNIRTLEILLRKQAENLTSEFIIQPNHVLSFLKISKQLLQDNNESLINSMISIYKIIKRDSEYFEEFQFIFRNIFLKRIKFHNNICETYFFNNLKISLKKENFLSEK